MKKIECITSHLFVNLLKINLLKITQILTADQIIYEQMLGLDWVPPEDKLLKKEDLPSYREAMKVIEQSTKIFDIFFEKFNSHFDNSKTFSQ